MSGLVLHDSSISGNAYKVRLLLGLLGIPFQRIEYNVDDGSTRRLEFLARNPNGKVPTIELEDGSTLWESNAILFHFAQGTRFWPETKLARSQTLQWMFFEQYSHEPYIAVVRHLVAHLGKTPETEPRLPGLVERGYRALSVMEGHLKDRRYFVADRYSIADLALYAYTHVAEEGGFNLATYPRIRDWLARIGAEPGHVALTD